MARARSDRWMKRWNVKSFSDPTIKYVVAEDYDGNFGCSCPAWKFQRKRLQDGQCDHIRRLLADLGRGKVDTTMPLFTFEIIASK